MERLLQYFVPEKYTLDLIIDKFAKTIGGKVVVLGKALRETVKFHAVGLEITSVFVDGKEADFKTDGETLVISKVNPPDVEVTIKYHGELNENMEGGILIYL